MDFSRICPRCFQGALDGACCTECGAEIHPEQPESDFLPRFTVLHDRFLIGQGYPVVDGKSQGYFGYDTENGRRCRIEELFPRSIVCRGADGLSAALRTAEDAALWQSVLQREICEKMMQIPLSRIGGVLAPCAWFRENGTAYFVLPFQETFYLSRLLRRIGKPPPFRLILGYFIRIAETLTRMHEQCRLLHGNVIVQNIMITLNSEPVLLGLDKLCRIQKDGSADIPVWDTNRCSPPELYSSRGHRGTWSEVYMLAACFYELATGTHLPEAVDRIQGKEHPRLDAVIPACPAELAEAVEAALIPNYTKRTQRMRDFAEALLRAAGQQRRMKK